MFAHVFAVPDVGFPACLRPPVRFFTLLNGLNKFVQSCFFIALIDRRIALYASLTPKEPVLKVFLPLCFTLPLLAVLNVTCNAVVLSPAGDVAVQQRDLLIVSTLLMLIIILPVLGLTLFFAWRYRASNKSARYEPDWDHLPPS